jgi:BolA family transcriptional regulator, general stress-responsive regulator
VSLAETIQTKLEKEFAPTFIELLNESHMHSVPKNSETHFRLLLVSEKFVGASRVQRSRLVYDCLKEELAGGVHALAQRTYTPEEWAEMNETVEMSSPPCFGAEGKTSKGDSD